MSHIMLGQAGSCHFLHTHSNLSFPLDETNEEGQRRALKSQVCSNLTRLKNTTLFFLSVHYKIKKQDLLITNLIRDTLKMETKHTYISLSFHKCLVQVVHRHSSASSLLVKSYFVIAFKAIHVVKN